MEEDIQGTQPVQQSQPELLPASEHVATPQVAQDSTMAAPDQAAAAVAPAPLLSKNAQKRLAKMQRYEAARPERLQRNKDKKIAKREAFKAAVAAGEIEKPRPRRLAPQVSSPLRILVDCSFDHLMADREIKSMCSQLTRCYADNRTARRPCQLIITGWNSGKIAHRFHTVFRDQHLQWRNVRICPEDYLTTTTRPVDEGDDPATSSISSSSTTTTTTTIDGVDKADLIYLSADADDTLDVLDESKVYIIGGIVDKNRYKNLCQDKAVRQGIRTAKLPIGEYIQMASRKVLTVNHVFEIMSHWLETRDWEKSFLKVIPKRKLPTSTRAESTGLDEEDGEEEEDEVFDDDEGNAEDGEQKVAKAAVEPQNLVPAL